MLCCRVTSALIRSGTKYLEFGKVEPADQSCRLSQSSPGKLCSGSALRKGRHLQNDIRPFKLLVTVNGIKLRDGEGTDLEEQAVE